MKTLSDISWTSRGISLLWGEALFANLVEPQKVISVRELLRMGDAWPEDLPSKNGDALVVSGLEGYIDLMEPEQAESWIQMELMAGIQAFQTEYNIEAALVFWLPGGKSRIRASSTSDRYDLACAAPRNDRMIDLGRVLWSGSENDVSRILDPKSDDKNPNGPAWVGLHHPRIS